MAMYDAGTVCEAVHELGPGAPGPGLAKTTPAAPPGRALMLAHLERLGLDRYRAADAMGIRRQIFSSYLRGWTPGEAARQVMEDWTDGDVPADSWLEPTVVDVGTALEPGISREQRRSRRKREVRARTISVKRMTKRELEIGRLMNPPTDDVRPRTRAECIGQARPCPWVSCQHHLFLDVSERTGAIKLNFPDLEVWEMGESCALDVADRGGTTLEGVGEILNLTRERVRQLEVNAMARIEPRAMELVDAIEPGPSGKRRLPVLQVVR